MVTTEVVTTEVELTGIQMAEGNVSKDKARIPSSPTHQWGLPQHPLCPAPT